MMNFEPIGFFHGGAARKYEAPRQGVFAGGAGTVELAAGRNFETALRDLDGFARIWLVFVFDRNGDGWRPTAHPPVTAPGVARVGVFASRAPYRPNPIGLSCVRLVGVHGRCVEVEEADLLDGTPILDIKPYIPAADAFPDAKAGWVDRQDHWRVVPSAAFAADAAFVRDLGGQDLLATATLQLAGEPFDSSRKRIARTGPATGVFSVRMFRLDFTVDAAARTVTLLRIRSGYAPEELAAEEDPYEDKAIHRAFVARTCGVMRAEHRDIAVGAAVGGIACLFRRIRTSLCDWGRRHAPAIVTLLVGAALVNWIYVLRRQSCL